MSQYLILSAAFVVSTFSKPISSCNTQMNCMDLQVTEQNALDNKGNKQYELCLFWETELPECTKKGSISHACPSSDEKDKIEKWESGRESAMCNIVSCGEYTQFGVKDGRSCDGGEAFGNFGIAGYDEWVTCFDGGYCGGGNTKACRWLVSAPDCDDDTSTTTTTSSTTGPSGSDTTTTTTTTTTTPPPGCPCEDIAINPTFTIEQKMIQCEDQEFECLFHEGDCRCVEPQSPTSANAYVRNADTLRNENLNFESQTYSTTSKTETDGASSLRVFGASVCMMSLWIVMYIV